MKKRLKIGIVFDSGKVSCKSNYDSISDAGVMDEVNAVRDSLRKLGHIPALIPVAGRFRRFDAGRIISRLVPDLRKARPDAVFNLCETFCGDARLQTIVTKVLDRMNIPYTGSGSLALELTTDKTRTKEAQVIRTYRQPALAEEYIEGRELNVAVFINNGSTQVLPISEIVFQFPEGVPRITSYTAKWMESSEEFKNTVGVCPSELPDDVAERR